MKREDFELLARIEVLENPENQGSSFDFVTWCQLIAGCIILPAIVLTWGLMA